MRIVVLVLVLLVLLPAEAGAKRIERFRWPAGEVIIVENRMGPEWNDAVSFTVAAWKRAFPRLRYKVLHRPNRDCGSERGRIVICLGSAGAGWSGGTIGDWRGRQMMSAQITVIHQPWSEPWDGHVTRYDMNTLCHEFGHALGLGHNRHPERSCVAPNSPRIEPGSYDRQSLQLLYAREGDKWP